jgi:hypothetical protein
MALSLLEHRDSTKHSPQRTLDHPDVCPAAFSKWLYTSMKFTGLTLIFAILKISRYLLDEKFGLSFETMSQPGYIYVLLLSQSAHIDFL